MKERFADIYSASGWGLVEPRAMMRSDPRGPIHPRGFSPLSYHRLLRGRDDRLNHQVRQTRRA